MDSILKLFNEHPDCEGSMNKLLGELKNSTGYNAGSITDIIEAFRSNGIAYTDGRAIGTGGGSAGTGIGGVPSISFSHGSTPEHTAMTVMGEMMHWAGMTMRPFIEPQYSNYYTDAAMATAENNLGVVMSVEQYRHTYPEQVAIDTKRDRYDFAESRLAHGGMNIKCLGMVTGLLPKYAKP